MIVSMCLLSKQSKTSVPQLLVLKFIEEHLFKTYPDSNFILNFAFPHLNSIKAKVLVNLLQEKNNQLDFIGTVQNSENFSILANSMTSLKCKIKIRQYRNLKFTR